jgi:hypothetical protein
VGHQLIAPGGARGWGRDGRECLEGEPYGVDATIEPGGVPEGGIDGDGGDRGDVR